MMAVKRLACSFTLFLSLLLLSIFAAEGAVKEYTLTLSFADISPACVSRRNVVINGQFPAPTITANVGDTLVVHVINRLENESASIHYHGLHQRGTPFYDGLSGLSQCPIAPGNNFTQSVFLEQAGTYFYHFHRGLFAMEIYGALIVYDQLAQESKTPSVSYDEERVLIFSDFYKRTTADMVSGLFNPSFVWIGDPDAVLINGQSVINCSKISAPYTCTAGTCSFAKLNIEPGKTYRLRLIGATGLSFLSFAIEGHEVTIFEADGYYVQPVTTGLVTINSGQRYSALLRAKTAAELAATGKTQFWLSAYIRWRPVDPLNGIALLQYPSANASEPSQPVPGSLQTYKEQPDTPYLLKRLPTDTNIPPLPATANKTIVIVGKQERDQTNRMKWTANHLTFGFPENSALLPYIYFNATANLTTIPAPDPFPGVSDIPYYFTHGEVVDVVLQNTAAINTVCEQHSWHLHGHSVWVLGSGPGAWSDTPQQRASLNTVDPPYRDSVTVFPYNNEYFSNTTTRQPAGNLCGWLVIRFIADNPGAWSLHCHVTAHMEMGMMVSFAEGLDRLPPLPQNVIDNFRTCYPVPETYNTPSPAPTASPTTFSPTTTFTPTPAPTPTPTHAPTPTPTPAPTSTPAPTPSTGTSCSQTVININFNNLFAGFIR